MRRLPIRARVAAGFAVALALVLAGTGVFLYARLGDDLMRSLDQDLRLRAQDLSGLVRQPGGSLAAESHGRLLERGESFAQLLGTSGAVVDATPPLTGRSLLGPAELARARRGATFVDRPAVPGLDESARLLAIPVVRGGRRLVLVVGATRENRAEALRSLRTELLIAGPIALVLATTLGYLLAGTGLRAVEVMRRRAAAISADRPGERLPVPETRDELARLSETLNQMLDGLEDALERERGFVADAGHELRTPLALLRAELDFALHHAETEAELREALREASAETDRLVQLAGDLLLLAGSERGELPLRTEPVRAQDVLESVRNRFGWRAAESERRLQVLAPPELVVTCDRLRLEQALGNLVDNALRHGRGDVLIEASRVDGRVRFDVYDEGPGFPTDFVPRAFHRFTRAEDSDAGGSGLGMAIVEAIACAHGGRVGIANADRGGTDVWLAVPDPPSDPRSRTQPAHTPDRADRA
jgi:two-component system, OmpR family, sensor kinase